MRTITIDDVDEQGTALAFDLRDLLRVVRSEALVLDWLVRGVECVGPRAAELHEWSDARVRGPGSRLLEIAEGIDQVIDGTFAAYEPGHDELMMELRASDSSCWDVACRDEAILDRYRGRFRRVVELGDL